MQDGFEELIEAVEDENKVVRWKAASLIQNYSPNETVYFQKIKSEETRKDAEKWVKSLDKEKVVEMLIDALNSEEGGNIKYLCNGLISHRMHVELFTQRLLEIVTKENKLLLHNSLKLLKLIENHEPLIYHQIHLEKSDENKKNTRKTLKMLEELGRKSKEDL